MYYEDNVARGDRPSAAYLNSMKGRRQALLRWVNWDLGAELTKTTTTTLVVVAATEWMKLWSAWRLVDWLPPYYCRAIDHSSRHFVVDPATTRPTAAVGVDWSLLLLHSMKPPFHWPASTRCTFGRFPPGQNSHHRPPSRRRLAAGTAGRNWRLGSVATSFPIPSWTFDASANAILVSSAPLRSCSQRERWSCTVDTSNLGVNDLIERQTKQTANQLGPLYTIVLLFNSTTGRTILRWTSLAPIGLYYSTFCTSWQFNSLSPSPSLSLSLCWCWRPIQFLQRFAVRRMLIGHPVTPTNHIYNYTKDSLYAFKFYLLDIKTNDAAVSSLTRATTKDCCQRQRVSPLFYSISTGASEVRTASLSELSDSQHLVG